jgi:putative membrane protein
MNDAVQREADNESRARTHLANERTFLAWFRTGLTLIALGVAAAQFLTATTLTGVRLIPLFSTLVVGVGVALVAIGAWRYDRGRARIDVGQFHPARLSIYVTSVAALATGLLALVVVWLMPHT